MTSHDKLTDFFSLKGLIWLTVPISPLLQLVESCWLYHEEEEEQQQQPQPGDIGCMVILIVCEWLLAFLYCGVAYSALISDLASMPWGGTCELAADGTACAAGALTAASAVGLLCVLCSRLRQAQAPLQPQA